MTHLRFHPSAQSELDAAARFYRAESRGLARSFLSEIRAAARLITTFPDSGAPAAEGVRRVFLKRFPFTVVYMVESDAVEIIAVMHQRQRPGYWKKRLGR